MLPVATVLATIIHGLPVHSHAYGLSVQSEEPRDQTLAVVASDDHVWFIAPSPTGEKPRLFHHARDMDGPYYTPGPTLMELPAAMAAWDDTIWLVGSKKESDSGPIHSVFSAAVETNEALGGYYFSPHGRLALAPALAADGELEAFAAGPAGPFALFLPADDARSAIEREGTDPDSNSANTSLLRLVNGRWHAIKLPDDVIIQSPAYLSCGGAGAASIVIVSSAPDDPGSAQVLSLARDERWTSRILPLDVREMVALIRYQGQVAATMLSPSTDELELQLLRGEGAFELVRFDRPEIPWGIAGQGHALALIDIDASGAFGWRELDPTTGSQSPRLTMSTQPLGTARLIHIPLLVATAVTALMLAFLFRPASSRVDLALPAQRVVATPAARLAALTIDLIPGVAAAMFLLHASLFDLLRLPVWTARFEDGAPALLVIAVTTVHCTITELGWNRTMGKALSGLVVASIAGGRPTISAILLRNLGKLVMLLVPPLGIIALLNRHMQGLGDMLGRTVVLMPAPDRDAKKPDGEADDR